MTADAVNDPNRPACQRLFLMSDSIAALRPEIRAGMLLGKEYQVVRHEMGVFAEIFRSGMNACIKLFHRDPPSSEVEPRPVVSIQDK